MFHVVLLRRMLCTQHKKYKTTMRPACAHRANEMTTIKQLNNDLIAMERHRLPDFTL